MASGAADDHRYRAVQTDPRELRSGRANRLAALMLIAGIVIVGVVLVLAAAS